MQLSIDDDYLLRFVLKKTRAEFLRDARLPISAADRRRFTVLKKRRAAGMPMQYIVGTAWFYGLEFFVSRAVLIPRPETELLVDRAREKKFDLLIDVGTGSGAIAIALAKNVPATTKIIACDISARALAVAKKNCTRHKTKVCFAHSNLLAEIPWPRAPHILIAANLPYLSDARMKKISKTEVAHEPRRALYGGHDGLDLYQKLFAQIREKKLSAQHITVLAEIDPEQKTKLAHLAARELPNSEILFHTDLRGDIRLAEIIIS